MSEFTLIPNKIQHQFLRHVHRSSSAKSCVFAPWTASPQAAFACTRCVNINLVITNNGLKIARIRLQIAKKSPENHIERPCPVDKLVKITVSDCLVDGIHDSKKAGEISHLVERLVGFSAYTMAWLFCVIIARMPYILQSIRCTMENQTYILKSGVISLNISNKKG